VFTVPLAVLIAYDDGSHGALVAPLALGDLEQELRSLSRCA